MTGLNNLSKSLWNIMVLDCSSIGTIHCRGNLKAIKIVSDVWCNMNTLMSLGIKLNGWINGSSSLSMAEPDK